MTTYLMKNEHDCGVAAVSFASDIDYDRVVDAWDYPNTDGWADDLRDNPGSHFRVLDALGVPYKSLTADILNSESVPENKIVMLLHGEKNPYLMQHWVVLERISKKYAWYHSGTTGIVKITKEKLKHHIEDGWPDCIYQIDVDQDENNYLWKAWDWFLSIFLH